MNISMILFSAHAVELSPMGWVISTIGIVSIFIGAISFGRLHEKQTAKKSATKKATHS